MSAWGPSLFEVLGLEVADLVDAVGVAAALEGRLEPGPDDAQGQLEGVRPPAQGQAVRVVVGPADLGGVLDPAGRRPQALEFVGHDGHADAGAADEDGPVALTGLDGPGGLGPVIDVIDLLAGAAAEVNELDALAAEELGDARLEIVAGVVGGESDGHSGLLSPLPGPAAIRRRGLLQLEEPGGLGHDLDRLEDGRVAFPGHLDPRLEAPDGPGDFALELAADLRFGLGEGLLVDLDVARGQ